MRKLLFGLAVALFATTATAQEKPFLGVGALVGNGSYVITVPMNVSPIIRIEPFLGYWQNRITDKTSPLGDDLDWESRLTLGAGVFMLKDLGSNVELHFGGRLAINREAWGYEYKSSGTTVSDDDSYMGLTLAAAGGAEYYFSPKFALGIEAEIYVDTIEVADVRDTTFGTQSFVTARLFF